MSSVVTSEIGERFPDVPALSAALDQTGYLTGDQLASALFLAVRMGQPILLEGEPGVGKTQAAKALAEALDTVLVRLQCYEGISAAEALYEWNYPRQLLAIRLAEATREQMRKTDLFREEFLLSRPLLTALDHQGPRPAVLLGGLPPERLACRPGPALRVAVQRVVGAGDRGTIRAHDGGSRRAFMRDTRRMGRS